MLDLYFNSLIQLSKDYETKDEPLKRELLSGIEKLNIYLVSIPPRYRNNINLLDFSKAQNVRLEIALMIFSDASSLGLFKPIYKYRDQNTGKEVLLSVYQRADVEFTRKRDVLIDNKTGQKVKFVPDLIEKYFKLIESPNHNLKMPLKGESDKNVNF